MKSAEEHILERIQNGSSVIEVVPQSVATNEGSINIVGLTDRRELQKIADIAEVMGWDLIRANRVSATAHFYRRTCDGFKSENLADYDNIVGKWILC